MGWRGSSHSLMGFLLLGRAEDDPFDRPLSDWAAIALFCAAVIIALFRLPKHWRNEVRGFDKVPSWWMFSEPLWRGYVRSMPVDIVGTGFAVLSILPFLLATSPQARETAAAVAFAVLGLAFVCIFIGLSVMFFNRPKFACPPAFRDQPGAFAEWREARRKRRARRRRSRVG